MTPIRDWLGRLAARLGGAVTRTPAAGRSTAKKSLGDAGERAAERYLKAAGFKILARQWRGRSGEIDLVARDGRTVVFVEVKTLRRVAGFRPEEAVDARKRRAILRLANEWAARHARRGGDRGRLAMRFDVVAVVWPEGEPPQFKHIRGAFDAGGLA